MASPGVGGGFGLNRTSVGLKHLDPHGPFAGIVRPQSNQRGIETKHRGVLDKTGESASIEPAWD